MASILLVEKQERARRLFRAVLEHRGHTVAEASRGEEALSSFHRQPSDAVIMDLPLPDGDGLATIDHLRHDHPRLKIVAISGEDYAGRMLQFSAKCGADKTFVKPVPIDRVLAAVQDSSESTGGHPLHPEAA
jgi:CheY-like chemotaxis protein